jgi:uncharacterized protein YceH (UPF0502 family)
VLGVLMLRGAQTPGELKQRTDRMHGFADLAAVQDALDRLVERELVLRLARRPGQKEERYMHRLSEEAEGAPAVEQASEPLVAAPPRPPAQARDDGRVDRLEAELGELRSELSAVREQLAELRTELGY